MRVDEANFFVLARLVEAAVGLGKPGPSQKKVPLVAHEQEVFI